VKHAKNTNLMVQCEECEMWHLVYGKYKLKKPELNVVINDYTYTYGASLSDLCHTGQLADVHVAIRLLCCYDPLEKLYYRN